MMCCIAEHDSRVYIRLATNQYEQYYAGTETPVLALFWCARRAWPRGEDSTISAACNHPSTCSEIPQSRTLKGFGGEDFEGNFSRVESTTKKPEGTSRRHNREPTS